MSDIDIVVKLNVMAGVRKALPDEEAGFPREYIKVVEDAADEIERLRAVVDAARFFVRLMQPQSTDADFLHDGLARKNALGQLEREIRALDGEPCRNCEGRAWMPSGERCFVCEGTGLQPPMQRALDGEPCSRCDGTGEVQLEPKFDYPKPQPCPKCGGSGMVSHESDS